MFRRHDLCRAHCFTDIAVLWYLVVILVSPYFLLAFRYRCLYRWWLSIFFKEHSAVETLVDNPGLSLSLAVVAVVDNPWLPKLLRRRSRYLFCLFRWVSWPFVLPSWLLLITPSYQMFRCHNCSVADFYFLRNEIYPAVMALFDSPWLYKTKCSAIVARRQ